MGRGLVVETGLDGSSYLTDVQCVDVCEEVGVFRPNACIAKAIFLFELLP